MGGRCSSARSGTRRRSAAAGAAGAIDVGDGSRGDADTGRVLAVLLVVVAGEGGGCESNVGALWAS
jgi:hypothetical protein